MPRNTADEIVENRRKIEDIHGTIDSTSDEDTKTIEYTNQTINTNTDISIEIENYNNINQTNNKTTKITRNIILNILDASKTYTEQIDSIKLGTGTQPTPHSEQTSLANPTETLSVTTNTTNSTINITASTELTEDDIENITEIGLFDSNENLLQYLTINIT